MNSKTMKNKVDTNRPSENKLPKYIKHSDIAKKGAQALVELLNIHGTVYITIDCNPPIKITWAEVK